MSEANGAGNLYRLVYRSRVAPCVRGRVEEETRRILDVARERNARLDVTGALLANEHRFLQILEGPRDDVEELFELINEDERHEEIMLIEFSPIEKRDFSRWAMAHLSSELTRQDLGGLLRTDAAVGEIVEMFAKRLGTNA